MPAGGTIVGLATRPARRAPMITVPSCRVTIDGGLENDFKGAKYPRRQVTVLSEEDWQAAVDDLGPISDLGGPLPMPWILRRANVLVRGLRLPRVAGAEIGIGPVVLIVTGQTYPCSRMDEARPGLLKALAKEWRGGVTCRVAAGGIIAVGDPVRILSSPPERQVRWPG